MQNQMIRSLIVATLLAIPVHSSASLSIPVTEDFFTTRWAFGAPYVRGRADPTRASLGVSTPNPFLQSELPEQDWEETTFFIFDNFAGLAPTTPVQSATLTVRMVARPGGQLPSAASPFVVSAQRVTADPLSINPSLVSGPGSFVEFKNSHISGVEQSVAISTPAAAVYSWDVTRLVNEWIANGDANFDYSIAMTGRFGNPDDTAATGFFHAFENSESAMAQVPARLVPVVPEPATIGWLAAAGLLISRRNSR